ncbi:RDD family protein [Curtobacterium flaccumfaciens]|uniref:RDD family protein n=1 Tax=Curtobacterium flaccumfaciens TaxID=2035 RepID=UPI003879D650
MARSTPSPSASSEHPDGWPGKDLGLPESGPRSVGRIGRRVVALLIDGALADLVAYVTGVWSPVNGSGDIAHSWVQIAIFAVLQIVFICLLSGSFGHICVGLRVVPMRGGYVGVWRPILRTVLLCLVVPALIIDRDSRGAHDRIAGTVLVRR